jgi:TRAP-type C4-dicarboxylate transport system permease small subunit
MPKLIRLYIVNVAIGFGIALAFVSALVWMDVANLRHLVMETEMGWLAFAMMVMFNGVVFAGVQFGIAVMRLAEPEEPPQGGKRIRVTGELARVPMAASRRR